MKLSMKLMGAALACAMIEATPAGAATFVNFKFFAGADGGDEGNVYGRLGFDKTGSGVAATTIQITGADVGRLDSGFDFDVSQASFNIFDVSGEGVVSAANLAIYDRRGEPRHELLLNYFDTNAYYVYGETIAGGQNNIGFTGITFTPAFVAGAVPEPATWAMMIGGFGLVGGAMRRRHKVSAQESFA